MEDIRRKNPKPLYVQLEELIRNKIEGGQWKPHTAIPSESELNKMFGVSRMTIRSACSQLVRDGLLYRVPGKGTFVADAKIETESLAYMGFREQLERMGYEISTAVLGIETVAAEGRISRRLTCPEGTPIIQIRRLRFLKGQPLSLHYSYIPVALCANLDNDILEREQLCVLLEQQRGLKPLRVIETLESATATEMESTLFEVEPGYPLLVLEDVLYDQQDTPYEYSKVVFRGDKIKLKFEYKNCF
ncbi:GntR family transcriptional regulator [Acetobacterium malicum]|jgi:GntR family transcriptional regulator|uniref:GntR family transcriptional regulator n=1 Tax=Acetobacterium malicum TaxID=52692 RepID=UPI000418148A|nr:GntR family transcriptional regulator [Acetobacterium dehalogenans]